MNKDSEILSNAINQKRIYDQCASMHFKLSDEYKRLAIIYDSIEVLMSILLCGITFFDCEKYFPLFSDRVHTIIGFISIFFLAFSCIRQKLGFKQQGEKHYIAGKMYAKAKINLSSKITEWYDSDISQHEVQTYMDEHFEGLNELPQIPEKHFLRLKHAHQTKVEFSKFLDTHKKDFWIVCKIKFRLYKNKDKSAKKS